MGDVNNKDQYAAAKQVFYDTFENSEILEFASEFGYTINGITTNIYRIHDGIHLGYTCNIDGVTEKEIYDVFSSAVKEYILSKTGDTSLSNYAKDNIKSLVKVLFIDKENFTIII